MSHASQEMVGVSGEIGKSGGGGGGIGGGGEGNGGGGGGGGAAAKDGLIEGDAEPQVSIMPTQ